MSIGTSVAVRRTVHSLMAAAGMAGAIIALPTVASGQTLPAGDRHSASSSASSELDRAASLMSSGKVVAARSLLTSLTSQDQGTSLSDSDRQRAFTMLANANRRMKALSPIDVSLQTAEDCLSRNDFRTLEHHAQAVIDSPKATNEQVSAARALLSQSSKAKSTLATTIPGLLDRAHADFEAGRVAQARTALDTINRSGVALTPDQEKLLTSLQMQVVDAAASATGAPGLMQPGVIKPRNPEPATKPAEPAPAAPAQATPSEAPAAQPAAEAPAPAPAAQPPAAAPAQDPVELARKWDAQAILAEADQAYEKAQYNEAVSKYERLLRTMNDQLTAEQRTHAEGRLAEAKSRMSANLGPEGQVIDIYIRQNKLRRDEAAAMFNNNVEQARRGLASEDTTVAKEKAAAARLSINSAKEYFSAAEVEAYNKQVDDLMSQIDVRQTQIEKQQQLTKAQQTEAAARRQAEEAAQSKARKIDEAIDRVRSLQREMKYEEALQVVDEILFLDPINPTGLLLRDVITDTLHYIRGNTLITRLRGGYSNQSLDNLEALIAPRHLFEFPLDWPKISYQRGEPSAFQESEADRAAYALLDKKRIPVDFQDAPLSSVVAFIGAVTQLNVDPDWEKLQEAGIDRETPVSLKLTNVPVKTVLDRVMEKVSKDSSNGAAYAVNDGVLMISSKDAINKNRTLQLYDVKDLIVQITDHTDAPEFDLQTVLQSSGNGGSSQSPFRDQGNQNAAVRRTPEELIQELIKIIEENIDREGWADNGGDVGAIQTYQTSSLIITNTPANHRAITGLLNKLREIRAMQINVEARFLLVATDFFEQVGFDLDVYFNGNNNQVRAARAAIPNQSVQPSDFFDFSRGGLQRRVSGAPTDANGDGTPDPQVGVATALPSPLSVIGAGQNSLGQAERLTTGNFAQGVLGAAPALGVAGQFLDDIQVDFFVKATQNDRRTVQLTAPRLTFTNGQFSYIIVATQVSFVSDLNPVVSEGAVGFDPTLATVNEGVRMLVQGTVSADRRYVMLDVDASVSKIDGFGQRAISAVAGGGLVSSATTQSFIQLPQVTVTRVRTNVTVPDQGTILLGGQRLISEQEIESGVPVLSKIPIINRFFTNRIEVKEEQTLLILIKPTILIQNEEEQRFFPGLGENIRFGG